MGCRERQPAGQEERKCRGRKKEKLSKNRKQRHWSLYHTPEELQNASNDLCISTPVKPHIKLQQMLVYLKDKTDQNRKSEVIYEIPCLSCNKTNITHVQYIEKRTSKRMRKGNKKDKQKQSKEKAKQENLKSAISDDCKQENHIMDWEKAKVIRTGNNKHGRWIREGIRIRKVNGDQEAHMLSHTWNAVLKERPDSREGTRSSCQTRQGDHVYVTTANKTRHSNIRGHF